MQNITSSQAFLISRLVHCAMQGTKVQSTHGNKQVIRKGRKHCKCHAMPLIEAELSHCPVYSKNVTKFVQKRLKNTRSFHIQVVISTMQTMGHAQPRAASVHLVDSKGSKCFATPLKTSLGSLQLVSARLTKFCLS